MTKFSLRRTSLFSGALLLVATASTASAQEHRLFNWVGQVDREVQIIMRGRDVWTRAASNTESRRHMERVSSALPHADGEVFVRLADGRGDADVIQQPTNRNNYTTIVRLRDWRSGTDSYRLEAYWRPNSNGRWDRNQRANGEVYPSNRDGNGRNGDYDRGVYGRGSDGVDNRDRAGERGTRGTYDDSRSVLRWSGDVDDVLEIRIQGGRIDYRTLSGSVPRGVQASPVNIPQRDAIVRVTQNQGRGDIRVIEQPSARNGYTTVLRVNDPQSGYGRYDFDLMW